MLVDQLLFEAWAKEHPEEAKEIMERDGKLMLDNMKQRLDELKEIRKRKELE